MSDLGQSRSALAKKETPGRRPGLFVNRGFSALPFRLFGLLRPLALAKPHPRAASVFVDEFDAGSFQRSAFSETAVCKLRSNYHWAHCGFDSEIGMINQIVLAPIVWLWAHRYPVQDLQLNQGLRMLLAWEGRP
jgi:hypothetical protein